MKRFLTIAALLTAAASALPAADVFELGFLPMSPAVMAQGGAATATAQGWDSFFANPAGFSRGDGNLTILQTGMWMYARPDRAIAMVQEVIAAGASPSLFTSIGDEITGGGFGVGASMGIGYAGKGLGLAMAIIADTYLWGPTLLGMGGDLTATVGFMGGMSFPLEAGPFTFHVGGTLRPMVRIHTLLPNADALAMFTALMGGSSLFTAIGTADAVYGVGVAMDLGVIAELGWFTFGLSVRDVGGTVFNYSVDDFATVSAVFSSELRLPPGSLVTDRYVVPMDISLGAAFHPVFGDGKFNKILDTTLHIELTDLVHTIGDAVTGDGSIWKMVHA
ncbi:MAG TPA: hypothetical protein VLH81_03690, partial [Desulfobacterales bacterium]|nr:hypothetical protein [Desulfobacterales bacterium]